MRMTYKTFFISLHVATHAQRKNIHNTFWLKMTLSLTVVLTLLHQGLTFDAPKGAGVKEQG